MALVAAMIGEFAIDTRRVVVVGFSMGGAGTWHLSARHADLFTAAIVMAGLTEEPAARLARIPTMAMTTSNSIKVKARFDSLLMLIGQLRGQFVTAQ